MNKVCLFTVVLTSIQCLAFRLWYPASLSFFSNPYYEGCPSVLAVAEGSQVHLSMIIVTLGISRNFVLILLYLQLTIWDLRTNRNGGCVQRVCGSVGDLIYALCSSASGAIAVGGTDRAVTIYDPRRSDNIFLYVGRTF